LKWTEISIQTSHEATEIIAEMFHELGASGVVIEDPELINQYRASGAWDYTDIPEAMETEVVTVKAYLPVDDELEGKLREFEKRVDSLDEIEIDKGRGEISYSEIQDEDWSNTWKEFFHPEKIGDLIVIKPSWEEYEPTPDEIVVELDPGMAFGTGTHPTTSMCIRELEKLVKGGMKIFDVGTGSGVLAIVAAKLGAGEVTAVDFDATAVRVATENIAINKVENIITTGESDLLKNVSGKADIIIANIIADIIIRLLDDVESKLKKGGALLASGIIAERAADVTEAAIAHGLSIEKVIEEKGWVAMLIRNGEGE
jgi:ribosomal protein L11 methyltransferase